MRQRRLLRLLHTLRHLRPEQIAGQLARAAGRRPRPVRVGGPPPTLRFAAPAVPYLGAPAHAVIGERSLRLINQDVPFAAPADWSGAAGGPLFAYHLHQFDWARGPALEPVRRLALMQDWVDHHRSGVGWEPGPISLRAFAWGKLLTAPGALPEVPPALLASLADQLATLDAYPERHLLANHYLWNWLALVWAGALLEGSRADDWIAHQPRLCAELDEQVGPDGAHYERSPMYHSLLLESVLDLLNAARSAPGRLSPQTEAQLAETAARMLGALALWTHPDGEIALFGDSAFGIAHRPGVLAEYAAALGVRARGPEPAGVLREARFARLEGGPFVLIASASPPSPPHQPGHAHCDALSFELSVAGRRVVTDTGVAEYVPGPLRDWSRSTRAHATVEVEGEEQAELWAAHRIGARPEAGLLSVDPPSRAEAVCSGWATPEVNQRRVFQVSEDEVRIDDGFEVAAKSARLQLPLAADLEPSLDGSEASVPLGDAGTLHVSLPPQAHWRIEHTPCFPEFGRQQDRPTLVGEAAPLSQATWCLRLTPP